MFNGEKKRFSIIIVNHHLIRIIDVVYTYLNNVYTARVRFKKMYIQKEMFMVSLLHKLQIISREEVA